MYAFCTRGRDPAGCDPPLSNTAMPPPFRRRRRPARDRARRAREADRAQLGSYKPDSRNFDAALQRLGLPRDRVLHVAQSLLHDHVPAKRLGLASVWIDRYHELPGDQATQAVDWAAVEPSARFRSLDAFADAVLAGRSRRTGG
jgi:hypothetical protein